MTDESTAALTRGPRSSAGRILPGPPATRWSEEEARRYYATGRWTDLGFRELLIEHAERRPEKIAYDDGTHRLTFAVLRRQAETLAASLYRRGVVAGDVVAVHMQNGTDNVVVCMGLAWLGAVTFQLPHDLGESDMTATLRRVNATAVFTDVPLTAEVGNALRSPALLVGSAGSAVDGAVVLDLLLEAGDPRDLPRADVDAVNLLIGTSGTTGTPKILMRSANTSLATARDLVSRTRIDASDTVLVAAPLTGGVGYINTICVGLITGCSVVVPRDLRPVTLLEHVARRSVTAVVTLPTLIMRMLSAPERADHDSSSIRLVQLGGAFVPRQAAAAIEEGFGCRLAIVFGSIDVGSPTMTDPVADTDEKRHTSVGRPFEGVELGLVAADGRYVTATMERGEVVMRGANVALGYFADPGATAQVFDGDGWGHLGDLGHLDEDGYLHIDGRLKDIINRGGRKISANAVEDEVRAFPGVLDVAAVGFPDPDLGERCAVFVVTDLGREMQLGELCAFLERQGVAKTLWPERIECVAALPVSPAGKVIKRELRDRLSTGGEDRA